MDKRFILRRAIDIDNVALSELNQRAFRETFIDSDMIPTNEDNLRCYFRTSVSPEVFVNKIADPEQAIWVIVDQTHGDFAAFINVGPCHLAHPDLHLSEDGEIYRLYVRQDYQGFGLGQRLMKLALSWLEERFPGRSIWLLVHVNNVKAQHFYQRYNFHRVADLHFCVGDYKAPNCIMRREGPLP